MLVHGYGYGKIIDELNEKGYVTKNGKPYGKNSIHEILRNEKYAGTYTFNHTLRSVNGKRNSHARKTDEEIIRIPGGCPALVSDKTWELVNKEIVENRKAIGAYSAKRVYLLSGLIFCDECGGAMVGNHAKSGQNKQDNSYYEWSTRKRTKACHMKPINKDYIEGKVIEALYVNLFVDDVIETAAEKIFRYASDNNH